MRGWLEMEMYVEVDSCGRHVHCNVLGGGAFYAGMRRHEITWRRLAISESHLLADGGVVVILVRWRFDFIWRDGRPDFAVIG